MLVMITNNPIINEPHYGLSYHLCLNFLPFIIEMLWMQTKVETMKIMFNTTLNSVLKFYFRSCLQIIFQCKECYISQGLFEKSILIGISIL